MPTLNEIEAEVDELNAITGNVFRFRDAFIKIEAAAKTEVDLAELRSILSQFRGKIPDLVAFKKIRAEAKDLAETLMLDEVQRRIERIRTEIFCWRT